MDALAQPWAVPPGGHGLRFVASPRVPLGEEWAAVALVTGTEAQETCRDRGEPDQRGGIMPRIPASTPAVVTTECQAVDACADCLSGRRFTAVSDCVPHSRGVWLTLADARA
jgi:hypothetical protein